MIQIPFVLFSLSGETFWSNIQIVARMFDECLQARDAVVQTPRQHLLAVLFGHEGFIPLKLGLFDEFENEPDPNERKGIEREQTN
jgi:hypothetical protein